MDDFNTETDSDYTSYWRDWVSGPLSPFGARFPGFPSRVVCDLGERDGRCDGCAVWTTVSLRRPWLGLETTNISCNRRNIATPCLLILPDSSISLTMKMTTHGVSAELLQQARMPVRTRFPRGGVTRVGLKR